MGVYFAPLETKLGCLTNALARSRPPPWGLAIAASKIAGANAFHSKPGAKPWSMKRGVAEEHPGGGDKGAPFGSRKSRPPRGITSFSAPQKPGIFVQLE